MRAFAIESGVACLLAIWAAFWGAEVLAKPASRAARVTAVVTPLLLAWPLATLLTPAQNYAVVELRNSPLSFYGEPELVICALGIMMLVPTLFISLLTDVLVKRAQRQTD